MTNDDAIRTLQRASGSIAAATVVASAASFVFVVLVARVAGPETRGALAFAVSLPTLFSFLATFGLDVAVPHYAGRSPEVRPALVRASVLLGGVTAASFAAAGVVAATVAPGWVPRVLGIRLLALALAATPLITVQFLLTSLLVAGGRERAANRIRVAIPVAALLSFSAAAALGRGSLTLAVLSWTAGHVFGFSFSVAAAIKTFGIAAAMSPAPRALLGYGLPAHAGNVADVATFRVDSLILGALVGARELGMYAVAVNVAEMLLYLPTAIASVLLPMSSARADDRLVARSFMLALVTTALGAAVVFAVAPVIIPLVFGDAFEAAIGPLRILAFAMIGMALRKVVAAELAARRLQRRAAAVAIATFALVMVLDLLLIPRFGASGAAWASLGAYVAGGAAIWLVFRLGRTTGSAA